MFSVAFFSLASLALSVLAAPLAQEGTTHPHDVDGAKDTVEAPYKKVTSTVPQANGVPHVGRNASPPTVPAPLAKFITAFEAPLAKLEGIVTGALGAEDCAKAVVPALGGLIVPITELIEELNPLGLAGVSAQDGTVFVDASQIPKTLNDYVTRLDDCLSKTSILIGQSFPAVTAAINTVPTMLTAAFYLVRTITEVASFVTTPLETITSSLQTLGVCAASSLSL